MANPGKGSTVSGTLAAVLCMKLTHNRFDREGVFQTGFSELRDRLAVRFYTSVLAFSADFGSVFSSVLGETLNADTAGTQTHVNGDAHNKELSAEYKEKRKLAKRIVKAVQPSLEDAIRKESELLRKPFEKELQHLDRLLELSLSSRRDSLSGSFIGEASQLIGPEEKQLVNGTSAGRSISNGESQNDQTFLAAVNGLGIHHEPSSNSEGLDGPVVSPRDEGLNVNGVGHQGTPPQGSKQTPAVQGFDFRAHKSETGPDIQIFEPPTPPISMGGDPQPLSNGGIPWYLETFDPDGTTIQEERWTGRDLVRGMSEELSDMGDEELSGLVDVERSENTRGREEEDVVEPDAVEAAKAEARRKAAAKRRRWRGYR